MMHFKDQPNELGRILHFLAHSEHKTSCIYVLKYVLDHHYKFGEIAILLAGVTKELENDPTYEIPEIWKTAVPTYVGRRVGGGQQFTFRSFFANNNGRIEQVFICLLFSILARQGIIPTATLPRMVFPYFSGNLPINVSLEEMVHMAQKLSGDRYEVIIGLSHFTNDMWQNWNRWRNSEISGVGCLKKNVDGFVELGFGVAGAYGGEIVGSAIANAKIVHLVGGVGGGLAFTCLGATLTDRFTQWVFNLPKNEALEIALRPLLT